MATETDMPLNTEGLINIVVNYLADGNTAALLEKLLNLPAGEIAAIIEGLIPVQRKALWEILPEDLKGELLLWLPDQIVTSFLAAMTPETVVAATSSMESADLAEVIDIASGKLGDAIIEAMSVEDRVLLEKQLSYTEGTAGRLMRSDWIAVRADVNLETVSRYLKMKASIPAYMDGIFVVDRSGRYLGKLSVESLLVREPDVSVQDAMQAGVDCVFVEAKQSDVSHQFERRELSSLAVVDEDHQLIGRITLDDILPIIREEAETPLLQMAGLEEGEDLFAPIWPSAFRRMFWLALNLLTAFLASWVIGRFEATLQQLVALAVLMPIVASMGGIAGSQTLTLAIRGLALGQISDDNRRWLAIKEVSIAAINGVVWAVVVGLISWLWFGQTGIAIVLAIAMMINLLAAAISGVLIPLLLERAGIDPALSGSVILTTVTDVVGFVSFLGLATWVLLP